MPRFDFTNEEAQAVINALAMQHPLVRKMMDQLQEQQDAGHSNPQRRAPDNGAGTTPYYAPDGTAHASPAAADAYRTSG